MDFNKMVNDSLAKMEKSGEVLRKKSLLDNGRGGGIMCEYCKNDSLMNNEPLLSFDEDYKETGVIRLDSNGNLGVFSCYGLTARNIKYCPVCGRSLE